MSELLYASFDDIATADLPNEWDVAGSGLVLVAARTGNGVRGTAAASRAANTLRSRVLTPILTGTLGDHGVAVAYSTLPVADSDFCAVLDAGGTAILTFQVTTTGRIKVYRGTSTSGTLIATTTAAMVVTGSVYRYLELRWEIHATYGTVQIRSTPAGGVPVAEGFGALNTGTATWAALEWTLLDGLVTVDDVYVTDAGSGAFKGDSKILTALVASQDVTSNHAFLATNWIPSTGSDKAAVVDDATPNGETDYLYARALAIIYYVMTALVDTGGVTGVQLVATARKVSSGSTVELWLQGTTATTGVTTDYRAMRRMVPGYTTIADVNAALWYLTAFY